MVLWVIINRNNILNNKILIWYEYYLNFKEGIYLYIKALSENEKIELKERAKKIKNLQDQGICFGCYNFETGDIFPGEGLIAYSILRNEWLKK